MQHGIVIWLDGSPELLASHIVGQSGGTKSRPLIFSNTDVQEQVSSPLEHCNAVTSSIRFEAATQPHVV